jgi:hypothetical protein
VFAACGITPNSGHSNWQTRVDCSRNRRARNCEISPPRHPRFSTVFCGILMAGRRQAGPAAPGRAAGGGCARRAAKSNFLPGSVERVVRRFRSSEEADAADVVYYRSLTPSERIGILLELVRMGQGSDEAKRRLERVYRVVELSRC